MGWLIVGCLIAVLVYGAMAWYANTEVENVKKTLVSLAISGLVIVAILLLINIARGKIALLPLMIFLFPIMKKLRAASSMHKSYKSFRDQNSSNNTMTRAEALDILGLKEGASDDEVKSAYRRLIANNHPDVGGSDWMASKLNEAKRVLIKK